MRPRAYGGKTRLFLPLKGRTIVWDGHDYLSHHRRFDVESPAMRAQGVRANFNRYAYDFVPVDNAGTMYRGSPYDARHYFGYGEPVYAPGDGVVIDASNDVPENRYAGRRIVSPASADRSDPFGMGNHVIIDHGDGEYSVLFHMQTESVAVARGAHVRAGQPIGRLGFSGDSLFPHLHYAVWTGAMPEVDGGVPSSFDDFLRLEGRKHVLVKHGQIDSGEIVRSTR